MSVIEHDDAAFDPAPQRGRGSYRARVEAEADRGYREQPFRGETAFPALTSLLAGLVADHACEERGAA